MSRETPLRAGERLARDPLVGESWRVEPEHAGHTMTVRGRIMWGDVASGTFLVVCSCGELFRTSAENVARRLDGATHDAR